jgi:hypothetical protein
MYITNVLCLWSLFTVDTGNILVSAVLFPAMCSYLLQLEALRRIAQKQIREEHQSNAGTNAAASQSIPGLLTKLFSENRDSTDGHPSSKILVRNILEPCVVVSFV